MNIDQHIRAIRSTLAIAATLGLVLAGGAFAQDQRPPTPDEASSDYEHPDPVGMGQLGRIEALPPVPLAFVLTLGGDPILPPWQFSGTVTSAGSESVTIDVDGDNLTLLYRLPGDKTIDVQQGASISVNQPGLFNTGASASASYAVDVLSEGAIAASGARLQHDQPNAIDVGGQRLTIEQGDERLATLSDNDFETVYSVPATADGAIGGPVPLLPGEDVLVETRDRTYAVRLISSFESRPSEERGETAEGEGYFLEFAVTPAPILKEDGSEE